MLCVVLGCDAGGCDEETGYSFMALRLECQSSETNLVTAVRLSYRDGGWKIQKYAELETLEDLEAATVFCPMHAYLAKS